MKKEVKSQAALEFLTTYAWAFLVIMITIGSLYYFGIFDFSKFLPQNCLFPSQFECIDFSFAGDEVRVRIVNNLGEKIDINSITITNDAIDSLSCTEPSTFSDGSPFTGWLPGDEKDITFTGCTGGVFIVGERTDAEITIKYCAPATTDCPEHIVNGKINAVVN